MRERAEDATCQLGIMPILGEVSYKSALSRDESMT